MIHMQYQVLMGKVLGVGYVACGMKGRTNGDIKMHQDWDESAWFGSHLTMGGHKDNVAVMEAEANDPNIKKLE
jgi:hypothetical protein